MTAIQCLSLSKINEVLARVRPRVIPPPRLRTLVESKAEGIRQSVERECAKARLDAEVRVHGSVAKDTWIREHADADIFMRVSTEITKEQLRTRCLPVAKRALRPFKVEERFAEHPYVESEVPLESGWLRVNVVPCYMVERGHWLSATDRTPYHTQYIREHITEEQRNEVRLLKAFMRGVGAYGADIKTGGFSGMLCETLVLANGTFERTMSQFSDWNQAGFIDIENQYADRADEVHRIFKEPLVVIDPVDKGRNLAAAVRSDQLWNFVAACRNFAINPSTRMFEERRVRSLSKTEFRRLVSDRGSVLICVATGRVEAVVDILWSQLYKTERALVHHLENNGFRVLRSASWSDEDSLNLILFELEADPIPSSIKHLGPHVQRVNESISFLSKHLKNAGTVAGPWIEKDRWAIQKKRGIISARQLLISSLKTRGSNIGIARLLSRSFRKKLRVLSNEELGQLLTGDAEFGGFLRTYLNGRPAWLA